MRDKRMAPVKVCKKCGLEKPREAFGPHGVAKNGVKSECRACEAARAREYRAADKERVSAINRRSLLKTRYGMTEKVFSMLLEAQDHCCAICGTDDPGGRGDGFVVDHCHDTGKIRGLLCTSCNTGLGLFKDDANALSKAIEYLEDGGAKSWLA
jgi:hypothetical protein